jgi:hypothetical protein
MSELKRKNEKIHKTQRQRGLQNISLSPSLSLCCEPNSNKILFDFLLSLMTLNVILLPIWRSNRTKHISSLSPVPEGGSVCLPNQTAISLSSKSVCCLFLSRNKWFRISVSWRNVWFLSSLFGSEWCSTWDQDTTFKSATSLAFSIIFSTLILPETPNHQIERDKHLLCSCWLWPIFVSTARP